jgi:hypothetical protein
MGLSEIRLGVSDGTGPEVDPFRGDNRGDRGESKDGRSKGKGSKVPVDNGASQYSGNGSMHSDSLRLTDDDRVNAFVTYASLLSRSRRLKEANKVAPSLFSSLSHTHSLSLSNTLYLYLSVCVSHKHHSLFSLSRC